MNFTPAEPKIAVIGLGYVGLPLAVAFAEKYPVIGFDINTKRIRELNGANDSTLELESNELSAVLSLDHNLSKGLFCTTEKQHIADCNIYIVTVPTPVDKYNRPDLTPMLKASETVAAVLSKGNIVIYESTVYPGVTEDECVPVLERLSGLTFNVDFVAGYSPERINPGDKERTVKKIKKVTSGSTPEAADYIDNLYSSVITAGTHKASSIKVAEAAKVIENAQRDINIAFVNELAKIFNRLHIDTHSVLEAAGTKWNFLPYKPGLVGGHCIGVDPYYLAQKAQETGYHPEIILAGRRLNDGMGEYVANEVIFQMIRKGNVVKDSKVLVLGITFKENCPDIRNSRVIDVINSFKRQGVEVDVYDPFANSTEVAHEYNLALVSEESSLREQYHAIVLAVAHKEFLDQNWRTKLGHGGILYDVKGVLAKDQVDGRL
jgi:UDP-N-acetyl-D-galactosamine dehydrogenase